MNAPTPQPISAARLRADMVEAMREAGIPSHLIYGYEKTGLTPNAAGLAAMTRQQRRAWKRAMDKFEKN